MRNLSQQFPQTSARFGHDGTRKPAKSILHNWWRTRALGFHQETAKESRQQTEMMENSTKNFRIGFVKKLYIILVPNFASFYLCGFRNVISTKPYFQIEEITINFSYKIQNPKPYSQIEEITINFSYKIQNPKPYFQIEEITTNFSYKIQNHRHYLNVSRNIII